MSRYTASKSNSLLKDNSWIKKKDDDDEDEDIDKDPNFGKSVLSHRSGENGSVTEESKTIKPTRTSTSSVHALTKRFGGGNDEPKSSTLPTGKTTSSYTKSTQSPVKSDSTETTKTTKVTKNGNTETTITTTQTIKSPVTGSPTKTFNEQVKSTSKGAQYSNYSPAKTTKVTEKTVITKKDAEDKLFDTLIPPSVKDNYTTTDSKKTVTTTETVIVKSSTDTDAKDKLYDTLIPSSVKNDYSPKDSKKTVTTTEKVTVKSSSDGNGIKTKTTTRTSSGAEDALYDTLLPKSITSPVSSPVSSTSVTKREIVTVDTSKGGESPTLSSPSFTSRTTSYTSYTDDIPSTRTTSYTISSKPSEDYSSDRKTFSYSRPDTSYEYSSITSPTVYTTSSYKSSRSDDIFTDPIYSKSSMKSVYASPERTVLEKDLCTHCRKPFTAEAKMVIEDMRINCHASCFKCEVCNSTLGHMKAGDSLWIYRNMVHCENCFEITREKWRR